MHVNLRHASSMEDTAFDHLIDTSGLKCPLPVLRDRKLIQSLPQGARLKIVSTDPLSRLDIPHTAHTDGHQLSAQGHEGEQLWYILKLAPIR